MLKEKDYFGFGKDSNGEGRLEELPLLEWDTFMDRKGRKDSAFVKPIVRKRQWLDSLNITAGFLLILGMAFWFWIHREVMILSETGYGETKEIVLNDNSLVRLNTNAKIFQY